MWGKYTIWIFALVLVMAVAGTQAKSTSARTNACPQVTVTPPSKTMPGDGATSKNGSASPSAPATCIYPTINFSANPYSVAYGGYTTLSWSVTNAGYGCQAEATPTSDTWWGSRQLNGSESVGPLYTNPTTFYLNCSNGIYGGSSASVSISVGSPGGGGGGGGGSCTENDPTQMYATFISSSAVPTSLNPGQSFSVNVTFQNTGACAWVYGAGLGGYRLGSQNPENNTTWGFSRVDLAYNEVISPGQYKTFTINATAPSTAGSYGWGWRMVREGVNWLGTPTNPTFTTISVAAPAPPAVGSFTVSPQARWTDDPPATLSWSCSNATSANISSDLAAGGAWSNLSPSGSLSVAPPPGGYTYTLTCYAGSTGSTGVDQPLAVFDAKERDIGEVRFGLNTDPARDFDSTLKCRWKAEDNKDEVQLPFGLRGGGVKVTINWCVKAGRILRVARIVDILPPNYPGSSWKFDGITSYGPCNQDCGDYVALWGQQQTVKNIWLKGRWSICATVKIIGSLCWKSVTLTVGVRIRGDGTREDTYNDSTP